MAIEWAQEEKIVILLSGQKFDMRSAIEYAKVISKYFMHGHMQITKDPDNPEIRISARHEVGLQYHFYLFFDGYKHV
jgi:hypothetical protein